MLSFYFNYYRNSIYFNQGYLLFFVSLICGRLNFMSKCLIDINCFVYMLTNGFHISDSWHSFEIWIFILWNVLKMWHAVKFCRNFNALCESFKKYLYSIIKFSYLYYIQYNTIYFYILLYFEYIIGTNYNFNWWVSYDKYWHWTLKVRNCFGDMAFYKWANVLYKYIWKYAS